MGEFNGVVGGVGAIITQDFQPWWAGIDGTVDFETVDGREMSADEARASITRCTTSSNSSERCRK